MSYLVLARKWRPQTFADVVGQQHVLKALTHALDNQRLHHAYLFAGTRGVGKTTLARILSKAINCEQGVSASPCGACSACQEVDQGRFVDLIEVDAASRTKVDDTRELLDRVQYAPTRGRYKVYLIDEVHMLSTHSFNALLKTLEEPPEHVKFLLATTDPQKLPVTVLSRCLQFNLKRLTPRLIEERLAFIAAEEGIEADSEALRLMAVAADGSLRDALSLMDQAIAFGGGALPAKAVSEMLGALDRGYVVALVEQLAAADANALLRVIAEADELFPDYRRLLNELATLLTRIAIFKATGSSDLDETELADVERLAAQVSAEDAQLWYQIALIGKRDFELAPDPRVGVEMTLLRMLAFRPDETAPAANAAGGDTPAKNAGSERRARAPSKSPEAAAQAAPQTSTANPAPAVRGDQAAGPEDWNRLVGQLKLSGVVRLLAANCAFQSRDGQKMCLSLDRRNSSMLTDSRCRELEAALAAHLDSEIILEVAVDGKTAAETPLQQAARREQQRQRETIDAVQSDAGVIEMQKLFDASLQGVASVEDSTGER